MGDMPVLGSPVRFLAQIRSDRQIGGRGMTRGTMRLRDLSVLTIGIVCLAANAALAEGTVALRSIPFAEGSVATDAVKRECQLETKIPAYLVQADPSVTLLDSLKGAKGRVLEMEIVEVLGPGGGALSGPKRVVVKGKLYQGGKMIGSFTDVRTSLGGVFGNYSGTCRILARCARTIGKDIRRFLEAPSKDANIGE